MSNYYLILISLLAPFSLLLYAGVCLKKSSEKTSTTIENASNIGIFGILISIISAFFVYQSGAIQSTLIGAEGLGFSIRLDSLSVSILVMISILAFVILRFSANYMEGDARKSVFFSRLAFTIASVELLILSGNLFQIFVLWIVSSVCLHYLLVFYRNRPQAIAAARKKFIVARLGDISLLVAVILIYSELGTGELDQIFASLGAAASLSTGLIWATILLVFSAVLKSAQFPTHGWLIEVVETPTPVSALLHAGLLNAGPFLMVRLSYLMVESTPASLMLIVIGGFTAMFASVVYLTQPSIKVSLGYSSIAHMGFSLLLCGMGIYSAAILHIVAHSFYKAHSFLTSGSVVEMNKIRKINIPQGGKSALKIGMSIVFALTVYIAFSYFWGLNPTTDFGLLAVGSIIVMGISQVMAATLSGKATFKTIVTSVGIALLVVTSFFTLEHGANTLLDSQIPNTMIFGAAVQWTVIALVSCYSLITVFQLFSYKFENTHFGFKMGVYLRNGFYANVIFDRMIGSLKSEKFKWANLTIQEEELEEKAPHSEITIPNKRVLLSN
ncbi:MAG: proton-conducting transporter membrane subunit [Ekhidna sp.]